MKAFLNKYYIFIILIFMLLLTSCGEKPELNLYEAKNNLEELGYSVILTTEDELDYHIKTMLWAEDGEVRGFMVMIEYKDSKMARLHYIQEKDYKENAIKEIKIELKKLEYCLQKYANILSSEELDDIKEDIKDYQEELEDWKDFVVGISGRIVWSGSSRCVRDSKD